MNELTFDEINEVNGGVAPVYVAVTAFGGYLTILDSAWNFGRGLGAGLYDALNK